MAGIRYKGKIFSGAASYGSADEVIYDNTESGLTADNVQEAIDEIDSKSIASITRSGNTFSAKNSSGNQLFTFDQKDENTWNPNAITYISRNGTTFTATRANNTTFTFDQQDTNTDIHGYEVVNYTINNLNGGFTNSGDCQFACKFVRYGDLVVANGSMHTGSNITGDINTHVFNLPWGAHEQFAFQWTHQTSTAIIKGYCNGGGVYFRSQPAANSWYEWAFAYIR